MPSTTSAPAGIGAIAGHVVPHALSVMCSLYRQVIGSRLEFSVGVRSLDAMRAVAMDLLLPTVEVTWSSGPRPDRGSRGVVGVWLSLLLPVKGSVVVEAAVVKSMPTGPSLSWWLPTVKSWVRSGQPRGAGTG